MNNPYIDYRILGKNIKDARERLDKTQNDVANDLGIIVTTYGKYERGSLKPNLERVIAICGVLSITLEDVFRGALIIQINPSNTAPPKTEYATIFQSLIDKCHKQESIEAMLRICTEIYDLENVK